MRLTRDAWVALVLILVSIFALWDIKGLSEMSSIFPRVVSIIMLVLSILYFIKSLIRPTKDDKPFKGLEGKKIAIFFIIMCVYAFLIWLGGFLIASLLFISFSVWFLQGTRFTKNRRLVSSVLCAVIVSFGFYFLFKSVFFVPLPSGVLFGA